MVYMSFIISLIEGCGRLLNIDNEMNNPYLLLYPSGSGQRPSRELEPHGTGIHLTPPSTAQLQGAAQQGQVSG